MLQLDEILEMCKKDSQIDDMRLDESSRETAKVHAKYLEILTQYKLQNKRLDMELKILLKDKWLHYNGKLDKEKIDQYGWNYDPLNGLKVLKGDMEYFYNSDPDLQKLNAKIEYIQTVIETLEEIMSNLRWRHSTIKNMIDWRRFTSGA